MPVQRPAPRRQVLPALLVRWLVLCLPVGLALLWRRQHRWRWTLKLSVSLLAVFSSLCMLAGIVDLLSSPSPVMAQSAASMVLQRDIYPLVADPDGTSYHLEGCIHVPGNAVPITLRVAAEQNIPADERCNPPRYTPKK